MIPIDLSSRTALVTGATGELGREIVRSLARAGAGVIVHCHHNTEMGHQLVDEIQASGGRSQMVRADVTQGKAIDVMKQQVAEGLGNPDIIVNNAVIQYQPWASVLDQDPADYLSQFESCVMHNVLMSKAFAPAMIERGWGRIIGINTECAMQCWKTQSAYAAAKRGMDGVLRVLAKEIGPHGVTVNQVAPGWTVSENRPESEDTLVYREQVPMARRGGAEEIAAAVAFLASDLAGFITGVYLPVCGGNVMPTI